MIEKVDDGACDVMHCTRCRTSFRYSGSAVVSNALHNPDQDIALQHDVGTIPRRDIPCSHLLTNGAVSERLLVPELDGTVMTLIDALNLMCNHSFTMSTNTFTTLRKSFEAGELSEERWGALMHKREMANARNYEMATLCSTAVEVLMTLLAGHVYLEEQSRLIMTQCEGTTATLAVLLGLIVLPLTMSCVRGVRALFNQRSREVAALYGSRTTLLIDHSWRLQESAP